MRPSYQKAYTYICTVRGKRWEVFSNEKLKD